MAYSYEQIKNIMSFAVSFSPSSAFPLDARSMFGSYEKAVVAAASAQPAGSSDSVYYYGQRLTVVENDIVSTYLIQTDGTLKAVGAAVLGDEKTITMGEDGTLSLKSFGVEYFAYVAADVVIEGTYTSIDELPEANAGEYALVGSTYYKYDGAAWSAMEAGFAPHAVSDYVLTTGWKAGLEPKVIASASGNGYEIAWYEPSTTTVEGLNSIVSSVKTGLDAANEAIANNKAAAEAATAAEAQARKDADDALATRVSKNETSISILNGTAETEGSVKYEIVQVLGAYLTDDPTKINMLSELVEWANTHAAEVLTINTNITANATAINAINALLGTALPETAAASNVIDYIAEVVAAERTRAEAAENALGERIAAVESKTTKLGTAAEKNVEDFATAEQGALAESAVQTVVSGDNGYVAVDNNPVKVYELPTAKINQLGGIIPDGTSITTDDTGKASVAAVDYTKVTGLDTQLEANKNAAVEEANEYTDENAVAKTDVVTSETVAESVEAASSGKVISEALFLEALTWKTEM